MEKLKRNSSYTVASKLKMPAINFLQFPKMKSKLIENQLRIDKKLHKHQECQEQNELISPNKLGRSVSFSLMTSKKCTRQLISIKKNGQKATKEQISYLRTQKYQKPFLQNCVFRGSISPEKIAQHLHSTNKQKIQRDIFQQQEILLRQKSLYPTVQFQTTQNADKRAKLFSNIIPDLLKNTHWIPQQVLSARTSSKKPMFNGKFLSSHRQKQKLPDELITRKLIWDGKQMKKVDHFQLHKDILQRSKNQKIYKFVSQQINTDPKSDRFSEFKILNGWQAEDVKISTKSRRK